jgi:hypothetical protein
MGEHPSLNGPVETRRLMPEPTKIGLVYGTESATMIEGRSPPTRELPTLRDVAAGRLLFRRAARSIARPGGSWSQYGPATTS